MKLALPSVTLLAVACVELELAHSALIQSMKCIEFGAVKMISSGMRNRLHPAIQYIPIQPLDAEGYNRFMLRDCYRYVTTDYCLVVQADGFVLNPRLWSDDFLNYDYCGAPWPDQVRFGTTDNFLQLGKNRVGNGGFSLRSKRLLEVISKLPYDEDALPTKAEDLIICHFLYDQMIAAGIRFAPPEVAARFSIESPGDLYGQSIYTVFGFHSKQLRDVIFGPNLERV